MNKIKKFVIMVMVLAMVVPTVSGAGIKTAKAAEYTSATDLAFTGTWSEDKWITETSGDHWYRLVIPSDGRVEFKMMSYMDYSGYELYTEDFSQKLYNNYIYNGSESQPTTEVDEFILSAGTYYLKIWGEGGRFRINAIYENYMTNDGNAISYDSPQSYSLGNQITGAITATDSEDWYKIAIPNIGYYMFNVQAYGDDLYIDTYNADLAKKIVSDSLWGGSSKAPSTFNESKLLEAGVYYIKISGGKCRYIFSLSPLSQSNCNHEYETEYVGATYTKKGYQLHKCKICGYSYMDNYEDKLELGQVGSVYATPGKRKCSLSWWSISNSTGYQIRYSTNKSLKKSVKNVKVKSKTSKVIKSLKHNRKYYFQVRAYKKEGKQTAYGKWSRKTKVKIR